MKRSRLRNKFLKTRRDLNRKAYNKQRNYVVSLLRKEKNYFTVNLNLNLSLSEKLLNPFKQMKLTKLS